jgi:hypothetical protein
MKFILSLILGILITSHAFPSCLEAYEKAARRRDIRNEVIALSLGVTAMAVAPTLFPTATIYFVGKYTLTVIGVVSVTELKRQGLMFYKNNFEKLQAAFLAAEINTENRHLNRIIKKSIKRSELKESAENEAKARRLIAQAFNDETFCPVVGQNRRGEDKHAVFRESAVVDYVAMSLGE